MGIEFDTVGYNRGEPYPTANTIHIWLLARYLAKNRRASSARIRHNFKTLKSTFRPSLTFFKVNSLLSYWHQPYRKNKATIVTFFVTIGWLFTQHIGDRL